VEFIFRDGGVEAEENARIVSTLANEDRVMAIAGPLTGNAAAAAAQRAQQERVPLLALSQRDGLVETGGYVFRHSLTARQQIEALLRFAMDTRGLRTFSVLAPENRLGSELSDLFVQEVQKRGGRIVGVQRYAESATDFRRQIKLLKGEDPDAPDIEEPPASKEKGVKKEPVPPPFDALFIPDDAKRVGLIAPQLVFYGIDRVQLLGTNSWNAPDLVQIGGRFVDGAVFVDGFFRDSKNPLVRKFVESCTARFQEEPSILEAQGYDAAGILLSVLDRDEVQSREGLRIALSQLHHYSGVTGTSNFTQTRDADKSLYLLKVQNGTIVQVN
jgi:ABC-type branched-subunit amino acid transport system substrate-binding protein